MDLSIIIPVWNEESKIAADIQNIDAHFSKSVLKAELIIVDDGSTDRTIEIIRETTKKIFIKLDIITCMHKGKGHAVRQGMTAAQGKIAMFMDCGANVPLTFIDKGMELLLSKNTDMIFGTRYHPMSKITHNMVWFRKITSTVFRIFTKTVLSLPKEISDSQCGFKLFNGDLAGEIFATVKTNGFLFDLEVILLARKMNYKHQELPLEWRCDRDTRLNIIGTLFAVLKDLLYLRKV